MQCLPLAGFSNMPVALSLCTWTTARCVVGVQLVFAESVTRGGPQSLLLPLRAHPHQAAPSLQPCPAFRATQLSYHHNYWWWWLVTVSVQFSCSVMSDSAIPGTIAHQASLSITNSWSMLKLMSIESVMPFNHLILCHPLLLLPSIFPSIRVFQCASSSHQVAKVLELHLQHQSFQWTFRTDFL